MAGVYADANRTLADGKAWAVSAFLDFYVGSQSAAPVELACEICYSFWAFGDDGCALRAARKVGGDRFTG